jgi:leucine-zipper of insertion element IS481
VGLHANARACPRSRKLLCRRVRRERWTVRAAAEAGGISARTAHEWLARRDAEGEAGLVDRPSTPGSLPTGVPRTRSGDRGAAEVANDQSPDRRLHTHAAVNDRRGAPPDRAEAAEEHETRGAAQPLRAPAPGRARAHGRQQAGRNPVPGEPCPRDRSKEVRGAGGFVQVCIDDATRVAYAEVLADENAVTPVAVLRRLSRSTVRSAWRWSGSWTDNGATYRPVACRLLGPRHLRTPAYRPSTNGKAGAVHPHDAERVPLRRGLSEFRAASCCPGRMVSSATTYEDSMEPWRTDPNGPATPVPEQRPWLAHLEQLSRRSAMLDLIRRWRRIRQ